MWRRKDNLFILYVVHLHTLISVQIIRFHLHHWHFLQKILQSLKSESGSQNKYILMCFPSRPLKRLCVGCHAPPSPNISLKGITDGGCCPCPAPCKGAFCTHVYRRLTFLYRCTDSLLYEMYMLCWHWLKQNVASAQYTTSRGCFCTSKQTFDSL